MNAIKINCGCGGVEMRLSGSPIMQYYCHCDDCQAAHGDAFACALFPKDSVTVIGETNAFILRTSPRTKCPQCGTYLFAEIPGHNVRGVYGLMLPRGMFQPEFHMQCKFAKNPIMDSLPHFKGLPPHFGGSSELMTW